MEVSRRNPDGSYSPAEPLCLACEAPNCVKNAVADCKRKRVPFFLRWLLPLLKLKESWVDEPIALCEEHSQKRKIIRRFEAGQNTGKHPLR